MSTRVGGALRDIARGTQDLVFRHTFQELFVYNILFEDSEVDEQVLALDEQSDVLAISGAGCGVAAMISRAPRSIDAIDLNGHHLALAALKVEAPRRLQRYGAFYDLLGRGWHREPRPVLAQITAALPAWIRAHWRDRGEHFRRGLYGEGLTATMLRSFRRVAGLDEAWLRWAATLDADGRSRAVESSLGPLLRAPLARAWLSSPGQLVALGINFSQRERLLETEHERDMADYIVSYLKRLASTDVGTNWFVWYAIAGQFDHERADAVPPYLRRDRFERAREARTRTTYRRRNVLDALECAPSRSYSHYALLDAPDWLDAPTQKVLLEGVLRTARDGARIVTRTVEDECMVSRAGLSTRIRRLDALSARATAADRTRQYKHVHVYEVQA
ncbi:MAG: BtaA family protein [Sandaracinaceae bacterium]|nr:BtaA family protein [Sandaracinaceae bacterium]